MSESDFYNVHIWVLILKMWIIYSHYICSCLEPSNVTTFMRGTDFPGRFQVSRNNNLVDYTKSFLN